MSANKKYFYMKLSENFFDSEKLILLDSYGHEFVLILLRMYLRSLKEGGRLAISEDVPYTEKTLSKVLKCSTKRLKQAIEHLTKLDLIYIDDTGVIWMTDFEQYVGTSTNEAERKRSYRHRMRSQTGSEPLPVGHFAGQNAGQPDGTASTHIIDRDKDRDRDKVIDRVIEKDKDRAMADTPPSCGEQAESSLPVFVLPCCGAEKEFSLFREDYDRFAEWYPGVDLQTELRKMQAWLCLHPKRQKTAQGMMQFINAWLSRVQDRGGKAAALEDTGGTANGCTVSGGSDGAGGTELADWERDWLRQQSARIRRREAEKQASAPCASESSTSAEPAEVPPPWALPEPATAV